MGKGKREGSQGECETGTKMKSWVGWGWSGGKWERD